MPSLPRCRSGSRLASLCLPYDGGALRGVRGEGEAARPLGLDVDLLLSPLQAAHLRVERDGGAVDHPKQVELKMLLSGIRAARPLVSWGIARALSDHYMFMSGLHGSAWGRALIRLVMHACFLPAGRPSRDARCCCWATPGHSSRSTPPSPPPV